MSHKIYPQILEIDFNNPKITLEFYECEYYKNYCYISSGQSIDISRAEAPIERAFDLACAKMHKSSKSTRNVMVIGFSVFSNMILKVQGKVYNGPRQTLQPITYFGSVKARTEAEKEKYGLPDIPNLLILPRDFKAPIRPGVRVYDLETRRLIHTEPGRYGCGCGD